MSLKAKFAQALACILTAFGPALAAPTITGFNPTVGAPGDQIQLTGSGFLSGSYTVAFGNPPGVPVIAGSINSDTLLTVTVPNGVTTGPISIQQGSDPAFYTPSNFLAISSGPYISSFAPLYGAVNDSVIITGFHFVNVIGVAFSGIGAQFSANAAGTQITSRVPAGATNGVITVSTPNGTSNSLASFTIIGPEPFITGFSPSQGPAGTSVQITGLHFSGVTGVTFNGQPGFIQTATSDTFIQVQTPSGIITGPIAVTTPRGTSVTTSNFFGNPTITSVSPNSGRANTNVIIRGTNFLGATAVSFNGVSSGTLSVVNNSNLTAVVPAGATKGLIRVFVPGASTFSPSNFVVLPTISGFSPTFGPVGSSITITGANLNAGTPIVRFNGVPAAPPTQVSFSQLVAQVPAAATTGLISVTTSDGSDTSANMFFLPGSILSFAPNNSLPGSRITITGQNFTGASAVSFNGTSAADFSVTNNGLLGATVPSNVITGPILVSTPAGVIQGSELFYGAPVITSYAPTHGLPGTNVTIKGVNFLGGSVQFNGLDAAMVSLNNTQIVATAPNGASSGPITVVAPAGTNTSLSQFTIDYTSNLRVSITNEPNPVTVGSNLLYTISLANAGPFGALNATFTNLLPTNVSLLSVSASLPWALQTNGNVLTGSISNFANGTSTLLLVVTPQVVGNIVDTVSFGSDNPDPSLGDNSASISTTVEPLALLSIASLADQVRISWPASLSNYVLQVENQLALTPQWLSVTSAPVVSGAVKFVIETNNGSARFYRLQR
jgi:uncharacterized repeat protein (TIGR01451 family)